MATLRSRQYPRIREYQVLLEISIGWRPLSWLGRGVINIVTDLVNATLRLHNAEED
jgi:hypothetical protein